LIDLLIDWCFTARQHKIGQFVPSYQGGLLAQAFKDSQMSLANTKIIKHRNKIITGNQPKTVTLQTLFT